MAKGGVNTKMREGGGCIWYLPFNNGACTRASRIPLVEQIITGDM